MFTPWPIGISLAMIFTLFHYCDHDKQGRTRKTAILGTLASIYCLLAGLSMAQNWSGITSDVPAQTIGRVAAAGGGKGALILILIEVWPYILIFSGLLGFWMYWWSILKMWPLSLPNKPHLKPSATIAELTIAAQRYADSSWFWLITGGICYYLWGWKAAFIPITFGICTVILSIRCTHLAGKQQN